MLSSGSRIGSRRYAKPLCEHPLDLADPDDHPGQLGGVGVELDAEHRLAGRPAGTAAEPSERADAQRIGLVLQVLEGCSAR